MVTANTVELDARGLEPPEPLIRALEAVAHIDATTVVRVRTDRRPVYLHSLLHERGFQAVSEELSDGSYTTLISRA